MRSDQPAARPGGRTALLLFLFALLVRLAYLPLVVNVPFNDMGTYWNDGLAIAAGPGLGESTNYPLYGYFLAGLMLLAGPSLAVVRVVQAVIGAGIPLLVLLLGREFQRPRLALLAGGMAALFPDLVIYCAIETPETIYTFLMLTVLLVVQRLPFSPAPGRLAAGLGLLLGLAQMARPLALQMAAVLAAWMLLTRRRYRHPGRLLAIAAAVMLLVILPYTLRNYARYGIFSFNSTKLGFFLYGANDPAGKYDGICEGVPPELAADPEIAALLARVAPQVPPGIHCLTHPLLNDALNRHALRRIAAQPFAFARNVLTKMGLLLTSNHDWFLELYPHFLLARGWWYDTLIVLLLLLALAGVWRTRGCPAAQPLLLFLLLSLLATGLTVYVTRYRVPLLPVLILFAAAALAEYRRLARWLAIALALLLAWHFAFYQGLDAERLASARFFLLFGDRVNAARNLAAMTGSDRRAAGDDLLRRYDAFVAGGTRPDTPASAR